MKGGAKATLIAEIRGYVEGMQRAQDKTASIDKPEQDA